MASSVRVIRTNCFATVETSALLIQSVQNILEVPIVAVVFWVLRHLHWVRERHSGKSIVAHIPNLSILNYDSVLWYSIYKGISVSLAHDDHTTT